MAEENKVYLVTSGSYSDYQVDAVFSTNEAAEQYIETFKEYRHFNGVEDFDLNPISDFSFKNGKKPYMVEMDRAFETKMINDLSWLYDVQEAAKGHIYYGYNAKDGDGLPKSIYFKLFATDKEHAVKIASEKLREIIATVGWGSLINDYQKG